MQRMVKRSAGVVVCSAYMAWAALAVCAAMVAVLAGSTGPPLQYSLPLFIALHPAVPLASVPALFDTPRFAAVFAFAGFAVLSALAAVLLYTLREPGRKLARLMSLLGVLAAVLVARARSAADILVIAAVVVPYVWVFLYLGRDYVQLRFQMAKKGRPPAPKMFRPEN